MSPAAAVTAALLVAAAAVLALPGPRRLGGPAAAPRPPSARAWSGTALRMATAAGASASALALLPLGVAAVVAPLAGALVWWRSSRWEGAAQRRRAERLAEELPHAVDLLTASLSSGAAPGRALSEVARVTGGPLAEELRAVLTGLDLGADPAGVWSRLAEHPQLGRLGAALHRASESGAPVAEAMTRLAEELRAARRADVEARVRQIEVKAAVPLAVCMLPAFVLLGVVPLVAGAVSTLVLR